MDPTLVAQIFQKVACFYLFLVLPNFLPELANFLHGYIRQIRDILQLWLWADWCLGFPPRSSIHSEAWRQELPFPLVASRLLAICRAVASCFVVDRACLKFAPFYGLSIETHLFTAAYEWLWIEKLGKDPGSVGWQLWTHSPVETARRDSGRLLVPQRRLMKSHRDRSRTIL